MNADVAALQVRATYECEGPLHRGRRNENLMHLSMCVGYGDWVGGRPPRTVCRNGGAGLARSGDRSLSPFFGLRRMDALTEPVKSILEQACGEHVDYFRLCALRHRVRLTPWGATPF